MSGLSNKRWKYLLYAFSTIYFISIVTLIFFIMNFSGDLANANEKHVANVKDEIHMILNNSDKITASDMLNDLMYQSPFEAIILDETAEVYRSNKTTSLTEFNNSINKNAIIYSDSYTDVTGSGSYTITLAVYPPNYRELYPTFLINVSIIITVIFVSIFVVLLTLQREMLKPIERLKKLIQRIKNFEFGNNKQGDEGEHGYDVLTQALEEFSDEMQGKIIDLEERYTELEISLQAENELNTYKTQLVSSLIHDLKTPLNIMVLQLDKFIRLSKDEQTIAQFESMKEESYEIVDNIKNILDVMNADVQDGRSITKFDITEILRQLLKHLIQLFNRKIIM